MSPSGPAITVFLPTYNRPEYTKQALESCLRQTYPNFRVVISDDTPNDSVRQVVESLSSEKVSYTHNAPALGLINKLNGFLRSCPTEWGVVLGDDDWFEPTYLETMARLIREYPNASLIRARYKIVNVEGGLIKIDAAEKKEMNPFEAFGSYFKPWHKIHINISGVMFKPALMREAGGFPDYYLAYHSDTVAWSSLAALNGAIFEPSPLVNLRMFDPSSLSNKLDHNFVQVLGLEKAAVSQSLKNCAALRAGVKNEGERRALRSAENSVIRFFSNVTFHYADKILTPLLLARTVDASLILSVLNHVEQTGLPVPFRFRLQKRLCSLPQAIRRPLMALLNAYRFLRIRKSPSLARMKELRIL